MMLVRVTQKPNHRNRLSGQKSEPRQSSLRKSHLAEWVATQATRKVPSLLLKLAVDIAIQAAEISKLFGLIESERFRGVSPEIAPDVWEALYQSPRHLFEGLGNLMGPAEPAEPSAVGLGTVFRKIVVYSRRFSKMDSERRQNLVREALADESFREMVTSAVSEQKEADARFQVNPYESDEGPEFTDENMADPRVQFHLRVWMPCWLLYGKGADSLYRDAIAGNLDAAEKLIRIDKRIIQFAKIALWIPRWTNSNNKHAVTSFAKSMGATDSPKQKISAVKIAVMALIFGISRKFSLGKTIPIPSLQVLHLRELFDAIAKDRGGIVDEDLPESNEALRKDVQRAGKNQDLTAWDIF